MSDSYTDRPSPEHHPEDAAYHDDSPVSAGMPKLGSLAQDARLKQLNQARAILLFIGILTIVANGVLMALARSQVKVEIQKEIAKAGPGANFNQADIQRVEDHEVSVAYAVGGVAVGLGVLFVIFGFIVKKFPVPITIISLVLYVGAALGFGAFNPESLAQGIIIKILIVVGLAKAIQAAMAYERAKREEAPLAADA